MSAARSVLDVFERRWPGDAYVLQLAFEALLEHDVAEERLRWLAIKPLETAWPRR